MSSAVIIVTSKGKSHVSVCHQDKKVSFGQKNVFGIIFSTHAPEQFAKYGKIFPKMGPMGHLGLRNFPVGKTSFYPPFVAAKRALALLPRGLVFPKMEPRGTTSWHMNGSVRFSLVHLLGAFKCQKGAFLGVL